MHAIDLRRHRFESSRLKNDAKHKRRTLKSIKNIKCIIWHIYIGSCEICNFRRSDKSIEEMKISFTCVQWVGMDGKRNFVYKLCFANDLTHFFFLYFAEIAASWEEWWTYDGISGNFCCWNDDDEIFEANIICNVDVNEYSWKKWKIKLTASIIPLRVFFSSVTFTRVDKDRNTCKRKQKFHRAELKW